MILVFLSFLLLVLFLLNILPVEYLKCQVPHPLPCWPVLGNLFHVMNFQKPINEAIHSVEAKWSKAYSSLGYFVLFLGWKPIVWILNGELLQQILRNPAVVDKSAEYDAMEPWLGKGLIVSSGAIWKRHRKLLNPAFSSKLVNSFVPTIHEEAKLLVERIKHASINQEYIDVRPFLSNFALRVISGTMMGVSIDESEPLHAEYIKQIKTVCELFVLRAFNPLLTNTDIYKRTKNGKQFFKSSEYLHEYTTRILQETKLNKTVSNEKESGRKGTKSFMQVLLEGSDEGTFNDLEIREELDNFMFAGHDTSSVTTMWLLSLLGNHPDVQEKIKAELDQVFQGDMNREVTLDDLNRMEYTEHVVKEGLRLYPPVPRIARVAREDLDLNGVKIKSGTSIFIPITVLHRNPDAFDKPNEFVPERFENLSDLARSYYVPFAAGPRNCIGQRFALLEIKMCFAHLLRETKLIAIDKTGSVRKSLDVIQKPMSPVRIKFCFN